MTRILSLIFSFFIGFFTYPISFIPDRIECEFEVKTGDFSCDSMILNGEKASIKLSGNYILSENGMLIINDKTTLEFENIAVDWFNYYGISYYSDSHIKGYLSYKTGVKDKTEEFFLEPGEKTFYSFIDNCLDSVKGNVIYSISFEPLECDTAQIILNGVSLFNREVPEQEIYIENESYKIGVDLLWGGALSYMEDLNSNVQAVKVDGKIRVDSNASERYGAKSINNNVNLINRNDTGRLVQQSYYGTNSGGYECGEFMGNVWSYNPVQGGNQFNESSKIVDLRVENDSIYIKCRPLDWAKSKEHAAPAYMEATYEFVGNTLHASCRFVDFSGYDEAVNTQEIPAFYCVEPLNRFVYYTSEGFACAPDLIFWPDAGYPRFNSTECWSAFIGEFDDSFGIGVYVPGETEFLAGVYGRGETTKSDPSKDVPTSYIALTKNMLFKSFSPIEYDFYLSTGDKNEIRNNFTSLI